MVGGGSRVTQDIAPFIKVGGSPLRMAGLNRIEGIRCLLPRGAFYVFPDIRALGRPSREAARVLLDDFGVAALSGTAFGAFGEGHLRFSYANSLENIDKALDRIGSFVGAIRRA